MTYLTNNRNIITNKILIKPSLIVDLLKIK